jgi:hypothetical protein
MNAKPKPVCASLEPLTGPFADYLREPGTVAYVFRKGEDEWLSIERLLFHWTMKIGTVGDYAGYDDRYCYQDPVTALGAAAVWADRNWEGEPIGWHRHPDSGRRREHGDPERETVDGPNGVAPPRPKEWG